jgi:hypothetical protein
MTLRALTTLWLSCWFAVSCAFGIPDYLPPPPKPEPCEVHMKVDGKYKGCISREHFERIMKGQL